MVPEESWNSAADEWPALLEKRSNCRQNGMRKAVASAKNFEDGTE